MSKYCECCEYTTNLSANLKKHLATKKHIFLFQKFKSLTDDHPKPKPSYPCKYCQSSFSHRMLLSNHIEKICEKKEEEDIGKLLEQNRLHLSEHHNKLLIHAKTLDEHHNKLLINDKTLDELEVLIDIKIATESRVNEEVNAFQNPITNIVKCPTKKYKKRAIPSAVKKVVWNTTIGEEIGKSKCYCCKSTDITQMSFHCGHIKPEAKGGKMIVSNLKPICQNCNSSMGTKDMDEFMKSLM